MSMVMSMSIMMGSTMQSASAVVFISMDSPSAEKPMSMSMV